MRWCCILLVLAIPALQGLAQTTSTTPAVPADTSTPRGTMKLMAIAMSNGDAESVKKCLLTETPVEQQMAAAMADFSAAIFRLGKAAQKAFGKKEASELTGDAEAILEGNLRRVDEAAETITGDIAELNIKDPGNPGGPPVRLKKVDAAWKVILEKDGKRLDPEMLTQQAEAVEMKAKIVLQAADELNQGKSQTIEQVSQSIQTKLMAAVMRKTPSSAPATLPTK